MTNMQTPLKRVRGLGSAKTGTGDFIRQRVTSIASVPLLLFFIGFIICYSGSSYEEVRTALGNPLVTILMALAFLSVLVHMRIGMQIIIEDYAHGTTKYVLIILNNFFTFVVGAIAFFGIVKIAFGG